MKTFAKNFSKLVTLIAVVISVIACEKESLEESLEVSNLEHLDDAFDFDQFGRAHNDYLAYVHATGQPDPKVRFEYGKTYVDPVFGSFDVGINYNELVAGMPAHMRKMDAIVAGTYQANRESVTPKMQRFLDKLATTVYNSMQAGISLDEFTAQLDDLSAHIAATEDIQIDLNAHYANDGASMLAIVSILKYSIQYWDALGGDTQRVGFWKKVKRALADAWGYVSAWTNNGDGSYSWDPQSALVNADCHSDQVYEN